MPEHNRIIKLHKGSDNKINFRIRNTDLKLVDTSLYALKAKLINRSNNEKVLEKYLDVPLSKGISVLSVLEGDLVNIAPGYYEMVILQEDSTLTQNIDYYSQTALYTDQDTNVSFKVEVTAQGDSLPFPTVELLYKNFLPRMDGPMNRLNYQPDAVACNAMRNHTNSNHTFALYCEDFYGTVQVYGSLDLRAPSNIDQYFPIEIAPGQSILTYTDFSGIDPFSFSANLVWAKFVITPDLDSTGVEKGKVSKILWRS